MSEEERIDIKRKLGEAVDELVKYMDPRFIPEVGANIVFALPKAREIQDVAGVEGRIIRVKGTVHPVGQVDFGASDHMARVVLTVMKYEPSIRSAANIRFSEKILQIMQEILLEVCEFDRAHEPPGIQTMDWGVASCCKEGVPDAIFDRGAVGKEAMIRILGEDPLSVVRTIAQISTRCRDVRKGTS
jgi:predicted fused transcriptional regulator/phosphomethylpyrimidine kinase